MYIGRKPQIGNFQVCDAISVVNGQATYALQVGGAAVSPETANHVICSLNGVIQKPGSSFTISSSNIVFSSNLATGDVIDFVQIFGSVLDLGVPSDATVTNAKLAQDIISGETAETSVASDDAVLIHDTSAGALRKMTRANFVSGIGGTNTPAFQVYANANQTFLNHSTIYKVTLDTEDFDTDNAFASDKFTVPSGEGGKYFLGASLNMHAYNTSKLRRVQLYFYKNGSALKSTYTDFQANDVSAITQNISGIFDLSASDYIEVYGKIRTSDSGNSNYFYVNDKSNAFWGFKIIE